MTLHISSLIPCHTFFYRRSAFQCQLPPYCRPSETYRVIASYLHSIRWVGAKGSSKFVLETSADSFAADFRCCYIGTMGLILFFVGFYEKETNKNYGIRIIKTMDLCSTPALHRAGTPSIKATCCCPDS